MVYCFLSFFIFLCVFLVIYASCRLRIQDEFRMNNTSLRRESRELWRSFSVFKHFLHFIMSVMIFFRQIKIVIKSRMVMVCVENLEDCQNPSFLHVSTILYLVSSVFSVLTHIFFPSCSFLFRFSGLNYVLQAVMISRNLEHSLETPLLHHFKTDSRFPWSQRGEERKLSGRVALDTSC